MTRSQSKHKYLVAASVSALAFGLAQPAAQAQTKARTPAVQYARTLADADITARYNTHLQQTLMSQQGEMAMLQQQIDSLDQVAAQMEPMLKRMFDDLQQFVASDIPFLTAERTKRIDTLQTLMNDATKSAAEKFRRLLEAYTIEMEYGRTMDSYRDKLADGRDADFVRLGRVSLMYRTADGEETGYWDKTQKAWVKDDSYSRAIEVALRMAKQETAPDLLTVPVPAATQGGRS